MVSPFPLPETLRKLFARDAGTAPIGLDFGAERLNLLQAGPRASDGRRRAVRAAVSVPYPVPRDQLLADPRRLRAVVQQALAGAPFAGRRVCSALAPSSVRILPMTVPIMPGQDESRAVARIMREQLGAAVNESVIDYYQVRSLEGESSERHILVAAAPLPGVIDFLDLLTGAGLEPVALDIGPAAMSRLLGELLRDDFSQSALLINFGVRKSFLTVIWGRRLMLDREIDFGELQLADKLAASLGLTQAMALAMLRDHGVGARGAGDVPPSSNPEVRRTIREILHPEFIALGEELARTQVYVASRTRGSTPGKVFLNGSLARYPQIEQRIGELVALPVHLLNPFDAFAAAPACAPEVAPSIALAAGLALREENTVG